MTNPPGFAADIKPMFRERDHAAMTFMFDLWDHGNVSANAADILAVLEAGDMPCDGAWSAEKVELFRRWIDAGSRP